MAAGPWERLEGHEQVVVGSDPGTGLRAVVAIHSTALGPALGGTRMYPYPDEDAALADVLRLARAMTYKNALAGLDHGGGKAVIMGDPRTDKTPELLRAYGRLVASLGGRYVTACDVGTYVEDMDVVAEVCPWTTGRSPAQGGAGDSGILTAVGVWQGIRACAQHLWGSPDLAGRRVGISGAGKVGRRLAAHLAEEGAHVVVADPSAAALDAVRDEVPGVEIAASTEDLVERDLDVFSPNALGGALTRDVAARLRAAAVCGGANNQLAEEAVADLLAERGVLYAPDYLVNCGGVIQVAEEVHGFDMDRARARVLRVFDTTVRVLDRARAEGVTPEAAAAAEAEDRVAAAAATAPRFRTF
ncbi:MAG: Glu/Leu/Phe/Val dehydrogenase dimerization domain-containing protein [Candidatus Nanopelagicales bacterium]